MSRVTFGVALMKAPAGNVGFVSLQNVDAFATDHC